MIYVNAEWLLLTILTKTDNWLIRPLVREGTETRPYLWKKNLWSKVPDWARHQDILTDWPSVVMWLWLWLDTTLILSRVKIGQLDHKLLDDLRNLSFHVKQGKRMVWKNKRWRCWRRSPVWKQFEVLSFQMQTTSGRNNIGLQQIRKS
jgi:hypothetical protein